MVPLAAVTSAAAHLEAEVPLEGAAHLGAAVHPAEAVLPGSFRGCSLSMRYPYIWQQQFHKIANLHNKKDK